MTYSYEDYVCPIKKILRRALVEFDIKLFTVEKYKKKMKEAFDHCTSKFITMSTELTQQN